LTRRQLWAAFFTTAAIFLLTLSVAIAVKHRRSRAPRPSPSPDPNNPSGIYDLTVQLGWSVYSDCSCQSTTTVVLDKQYHLSCGEQGSHCGEMSTTAHVSLLQVDPKLQYDGGRVHENCAEGANLLFDKPVADEDSCRALCSTDTRCKFYTSYSDGGCQLARNCSHSSSSSAVTFAKLDPRSIAEAPVSPCTVVNISITNTEIPNTHGCEKQHALPLVVGDGTTASICSEYGIVGNHIWVSATIDSTQTTSRSVLTAPAASWYQISCSNSNCSSDCEKTQPFGMGKCIKFNSGGSMKAQTCAPATSCSAAELIQELTRVPIALGAQNCRRCL
jgi:hypothetical protein